MYGQSFRQHIVGCDLLFFQFQSYFVQETDKPIETEKQRLSTAFENNKKNEGGETRHLKTINEQYEGQKYPGTDVEYKHERIQVNGEKVEGVFPKFESKDVERLPRKMWESSDAQQFSR